MAIAVTYRWGITALIFGQIITSGISYALNSYYTGKLLDYPMSEQIKDLLPMFGIAGIMGISIRLLNYASISSQFSLLCGQAVTGIVLYTLLCYLLKMPSFMEIIGLIKQRHCVTHTQLKNQ